MHVGDSRAYLLRGGELAQITHDDTYVQYLVDSGKLTPDEAKDHPRKSVILRALRGAEVEPDVSIREARDGDRYLLCTDGLSDVVSTETIAETLRIHDPQECADRLVELALRGGGPDNVTVIVADVVNARPGDVDRRRARCATARSSTRPRPRRHRRRQRRRTRRGDVPSGRVPLPSAAPAAKRTQALEGPGDHPRHPRADLRGARRHVRLDADAVLRRPRRQRGRDLPRRRTRRSGR